VATGYRPVDQRFGPLLLHGAWIEQGAAADTALTLLLCWESLAPVAGRYQLAMRLLDDEGWEISQADAPLVDEFGRPTEQWPAGAAVTTYHVLPVAPATPPLRYTVALRVYTGSGENIQAIEVVDTQGVPQGQQVIAGAVQFAPPRFAGSGVTNSHNPYALVEPPWLDPPLEMAGGLHLVAAEFARGPYFPGQTIPLFLTWKATEAGLPRLEPQVVLEQEGIMLQESSGRLLADVYPTSQWRPGELVRERRLVTLPFSAAAGGAVLSLRLGGRHERLGELQIAAVERLASLPSTARPVEASYGGLARLVGYELPQTTVRAAEAVSITLYWQALQTGGADYTVFVHLLDESGRLIGQHDGEPAGGQRPVSSWVAGELIADPHSLVFRHTEYTGTATIQVGLYDPLTGRRLSLPAGGDVFPLPANLLVER
jgi:hypothetical protein